jgi:tetratricopeptide (TPR) repeat protein
MKAWSFCAIAALAAALVSGEAAAMCGQPLERNAFGRPIDYTDPADQDYVKQWVEPFHFTPEVEGLIRGKSTDIPGDLAYVLRQIPNHHRALNSMMRWQIAHGRPIDAEERLIYTIDCYFERAIEFRPNDPMLHMLLGIYFHRTKKYEDAIKAYERAESLAPDNAEIQYNMGLALFDAKQYDLAKEHADRAYQMGYPMPGLRNKLKSVGR